MYLARDYQVESLLTKCDEYLGSKLDVNNCLEVYKSVSKCGRLAYLSRIENYIAK